MSNKKHSAKFNYYFPYALILLSVLTVMPWSKASHANTISDNLKIVPVEVKQHVEHVGASRAYYRSLAMDYAREASRQLNRMHTYKMFVHPDTDNIQPTDMPSAVRHPLQGFMPVRCAAPMHSYGADIIPVKYYLFNFTSHVQLYGALVKRHNSHTYVFTPLVVTVDTHITEACDILRKKLVKL